MTTADLLQAARNDLNELGQSPTPEEKIAVLESASRNMLEALENLHALVTPLA